MQKAMLLIFSAFFTSLSVIGCGNKAEDQAESSLVSYPQRIDPDCRTGSARLYDECSSQVRLFEAALTRANAAEKTLLVSFGAEWCIWCHVFEKYIKGQYGKFEYTYSSSDEPDKKYTDTLREKVNLDVAPQAEELRNFVSENFVLVHIDMDFAPDGWDVLDKSAAWEHYSDSIPFVFTVNAKGQYASSFNHNDVEVRRDGLIDWYRGYDREKLLTQLEKMKKAAAVF
jgi:thiol-disulfide isomerase/thioredoxin